MRSPDIQAPSLESQVDGPSRLRVFTLVDGIGTYGGAESLAREIVQRIDGSRFERTFCVSRWDPSTLADETVATARAELDAAGVRFIGLERAGRLALGPWASLIRTMRRERVDILHAHKFGSNVWAAAISPFAQPGALIAHEHSWAFEGRPMRRILDRQLIARRADVFIAVSAEDKRRMTAIEGIPADMIELVPNGIADPPPRSDRGDVRAELGIATGSPVIGTVATLRPYKGVDVLLQAAALLVPDWPDLQVLVAGGDEGTDTSVRAGLRELIAREGIEANVHLLGFRDDIPAVVDAFDVAVCSSDFEGSPLSVMEYMEEAKPVVATAVGGLPDLIADGDQGYLVGVRDPAALAAGIGKLLADPEAARRMGEAGQRLRREEFSIDATVAKIEALYERLAGRG